MKKNLMPHTQRIVEAEIARTRGKRSVDPERPKELVAITDQKALLNLDPMRILNGEIKLYDPRERSPR